MQFFIPRSEAAKVHASMLLALKYANTGLYLTSPNPRVGCTLTTADGQLIAQGHTQRAGQAHAEVMALRDAAAKGLSVKGATAYVTLEPCSHHGRTPPCCNALINAGIAKVVVALLDPNPLVAGNGVAHSGLLQPLTWTRSSHTLRTCSRPWKRCAA